MIFKIMMTSLILILTGILGMKIAGSPERGMTKLDYTFVAMFLIGVGGFIISLLCMIWV